MKDVRGGIFSAMKVSLLAGVAMVGVSPALAQETAAPATGAASASALVALPVAQASGAAPEADPMENEVVVTGSLVTKSGFDMPSPVTVITEEDIAQIGSPDIADVINQIPSVRASLTNDSTANQSSAAGGTFADLRGLGAVRTLVLVDGRRYAPTNGYGSVSTASLPQVAITGVDIVTGGASATYGSDAVAGVINYKLNDRLQGVKGKIQSGISDYGDYQNYLVSLAYGTSFLNNRMRLLVAGEVAENRGIEYAGDRPWARGVTTITNPAWTSTNDEPRNLLVSDARYSNVTMGGVIQAARVGTSSTNNTNNPLVGLMFMEDGSASPMVYGDHRSATTMVGGSGAPLGALNAGTIPQNRRTFFGRLVFDPTDSLSFFAEANYARMESTFENGPGQETLVIRADNPYLPQSVVDVMRARNYGSIVIGRHWQDNRREVRSLDVESRRFLFGAEGRIGSSWNWDAYYSTGTTDNYSLRQNSRLVDPFALALDAVINPANGAIVCRSTLTDPTNGCVPINMIGEGRQSEASLAYVTGSGGRNINLGQHVIAAKISGEPFSTWAGPVAVAFGAEHRWLSVDATSHILESSYAFTAGGYTPWSGKQRVKEAFGEVLVPLAKDARFAKNLSMTLAGRVTDYLTSGTVFTWKVGGNYAPVSWVRMRATRSRDIRAPGMEELFLGGRTAPNTARDTLLGQSYAVEVLNTGNPLLTPEKADAFTAGVVVSPPFLRGLRLSADFWNIKVSDAMVTLATNDIIRHCYETNRESACQMIVRPSPGERITRVIAGPINLDSMSVRGFDFEVAYRTRLGKGRLNLRTMATYFDEGLIISEQTGITELHDSVEQGVPRALGGSPRWKVNTSATYSQGGAFVRLSSRYVGGGRITPGYTYKNLNVLNVKGRMYFDVSAEYPLFKSKDDSVVLFGSVRNLLNTDPPITGQSQFATTRALYDVIGRVYSGGVKFRF